MWIFKFILIFLIFIKPSFSNELYISEDYDIKFVSGNIKQKKQEAIDLIKIDSFDKIIKSLLTDADYEVFKKNINNELINIFLFSIDINQEKINNNNYSSKIKIAYQKTKIIDYLIKNRINYVPYETEKFLLIIFDQEIFSEKILSKENRFYKYLLNTEINYEFFIIPNLDINDRYIVKKEDFLIKKIHKFERLSNKYKSKNILLVHSKSNLDDVQINSYIYKNDNFELLDNFSSSIIDYHYFFENLQTKAIDFWKNENIVDTSISEKLSCRIETLNLRELKKIKEIITKNNMIKNIKAREISFKNSVYDINFYGSLNILIKSLKLNKIDLIYNNNNCNIKIS